MLIREHGSGEIKKWSELSNELELAGRHIESVNSNGYALVECIQEYLHREYDINYSMNDIVEKVAFELVSNPEYTKYYSVPLDQDTVNRNMVDVINTKNGRLLMDMYLPALATSLDVYIKVCQEVHGYIAIVTTTPLNLSTSKKSIMLVFEDNKYKLITRYEKETESIQTTTTTEKAETSTPSTSQKIPTTRIKLEKEQKLIQMYREAFRNTPGETTETSTDDTTQTSSPTFSGGIRSCLVNTQEINSTQSSSPTFSGGNKRSLVNQEKMSTQPKKKVRFSPQLVQLDNSPSAVKEIDYITIESSSDEEAMDISENDNLLERATGLVQQIRNQMTSESPPLPNIKSPVISKGKYFNMSQFQNLIPEVVEKLPQDINGTKLYLIDCKEAEGYDWQKTYRDGRFFTLNTSRRKGFRGSRRIGKCNGNFECKNEECPMIKNGIPNCHQFKTVGSMKFCFSCDTLAERKPCNAVKCVEYSDSSKLLTVYHSGEHTCTCKIDIYENDVFIQQALKETSGAVGPRELAKIKMTKELQSQRVKGQNDMMAIVNIASQLTDSKRINDIKRKINFDLKNELHSLSAVGELKSTTDTKDKYLIYKINDNNMNQQPSYVFKFSRKMAEIAISMDISNSDNNDLKNEFVYFDGMHSRCKSWKTLTTWVYHPPSRRLLRLATMEVKGETSEYVGLFWKLFNEVLSGVKGEEYIFNPRGFITDEAGANFNGISREFGGDVLAKCYSCGFHFKQCLRNLLGKIPGEMNEIKNEVQELGVQLLTVGTLNDYKEIQSRFQVLGAIVPPIKNWIDWWDARRYHLFPVFRGYSISSVNMAEIGHSTLKRNKPIMLVDACWEDTCSLILQEEELDKFQKGRGYSHGRGPSTVKTALREKKSQLKRVKDYKEMFKQGGIEVQEGQENRFVPSNKARHKAPFKYSTKDPLQGQLVGFTGTNTVNTSGPPTSQSSPRKVIVTHTNNIKPSTSQASQSSGIIKIVKLPKSFSSIPMIPTYGTIPSQGPVPVEAVSQSCAVGHIRTPFKIPSVPTYSTIPPQGAVVLQPVSQSGSPSHIRNPFKIDDTNPPLLCFLNGSQNVSICYGCKKKFEPKLRNPPNDLICKMLVLRDRLISSVWVPGWRRTWGYFHLSIECLRRGRTTIEAGDIYIPNEIIHKLRDEHVDFLRKKGWWHIMRRRE